MRTIHKYPFVLNDSFDVWMPEGAKVVAVDLQVGKPTLWAEVENENCEELRQFAVVGTGMEIDPRVQHIGTFQQGMFVWHVYEYPK